jgi:hypothetical protein
MYGADIANFSLHSLEFFPFQSDNFIPTDVSAADLEDQREHETCAETRCGLKSEVFLPQGTGHVQYAAGSQEGRLLYCAQRRHYRDVDRRNHQWLDIFAQWNIFDGLSILGKGQDFPGLVTLIKQYLDSADVDVDTRCTVSQYLKFIQVTFLRSSSLLNFAFRNALLAKYKRWRIGFVTSSPVTLITRKIRLSAIRLPTIFSSRSVTRQLCVSACLLNRTIICNICASDAQLNKFFENDDINLVTTSEAQFIF